MKLGFIAALAGFLFTTAAHAGVITYQMIFTDQSGQQVGQGTLSFDPSVRVEIGRYQDQFCFQGIESCPFDIELIELRSFELSSPLTPVSFSGQVGSHGFDGGGGLGGNLHYLEADLFVGKGSGGSSLDSLLNYQSWTFDINSGVGPLFVGIPDFTAAIIASSFGSFESLAIITGTVTFTRVSEIPAPASIWVFLSGIAAIGGVRRLRKSRPVSA